MSQAEAERFVADLKQDSGMLEELKTQATSIDAVAEFARGKGYDLSADDARAYIQAQASHELTDQELDAVAGGKSSTNITIPGVVTQIATMGFATLI